MNSDFSLRFRRITMLMVVCALPTLSGADAYDENHLVQVLPGTDELSTLVIDLQNLNTPDLQGDTRTIYRSLVVPSVAKPEIRILSYTVAVEDKGKVKELDGQPFESIHGKVTAEKLITYSYVGQFRGYRIGKIGVVPRSKTYAKDKATSFELTEMQAEIRFPKSDAPIEIGSEDPFGRRMLEHLVLNPQALATAPHLPDAPSAQRIDAAKNWTASLLDGMQAAPVARFEVRHEGMTTVTSDELTSAGINLQGYAPDGFRLFRDGIEVPLAILDSSETDWTLGFAVPPFPEHEVYSSGYFLFADSPGLKRKARRFVQDTKESTTGTVVSTGRRKVVLQERRKYLHKIPIDQNFSHWYYLDLPPNELVSLPVNLPDLDPAGADVSMRLHLAIADPKVEHQCRTYVNGVEVDLVNWTNGRNKIHDFKVPAKPWRAGANNVVFEFSTQNLKNPAKALYLSRCEIDYPQVLTATDNRLRSQVTIRGDSAIQLRGLPSGAFLADLTNLGRPQLLNLLPAPEGGAFLSPQIGKGMRVLDAFTIQSANHVAAIRPVATLKPLLDTVAEVENLIIAPSEYLPALQPLLAHRRENDDSLAAVALEDVFLQFGYGNRKPAAIRTFLQAAYYRNEFPKLSSVLLIGESSDLAGLPGEWPAEANPDQLPVFWERKPAKEPRGDFDYSLMDAGRDLPDISIARIPAKSAEALATVVSKIINYETRQQAGIWRSRNLFIMDDEPIFEEIADELKISAIPGQFQTVNVKQADFPYIHSFNVGQSRWSPDASAEVLNRLNEGALTTVFFGHGGPNIFSHERLFHIDEMPKISNPQTPTLLAIASCDSAWLDYPMAPGEFSLGERFIMHPTGGAIGVFAPIGAATPGEHQDLLEPYMAGMFRHEIDRIGDAVLYALLKFESSAGGDVHEQYVLLGDPLTRLLPPPHDLSVFASPAIHILNSASVIRINANWPSVNEGKATIALRISQKDNQIIASDVPVRNGRLVYEWKAGTDLPEGAHMISVYGESADGTREALGEAKFEVMRQAFQLAVNPEILHPKVRKAGEEVKIAFTIDNRLSTEARDVTLLVRSAGEEHKALEQKLNLAPRERLSREISVKMTEGVKALDFFVYGPGASPEATEPWERARIVFPVMTSSPSHRIASLGDLIDIHPKDLPPDEPLRFSVPIWNLGAKESPKLTLTLQDETGRQLGDPTQMDYGMESGGHVIVDFTDDQGLPPGRRRLTLSVRAQGSKDAFQRPLLTVDRIVQIDPHSDLEFAAGSIRFDSKEFIDGQTIYIETDLVNIGGRDSLPTTVEAYKGTERLPKYRISSSFKTDRIQIPALKPGETHRVRIRWDEFHAVGTHRVRLFVNPDKQIKENDYENNWIDGEVTIHPHGNIFIVDGKLNATPAIARVGDKIRLDARIRTDRKQDLSEMRVALFGGSDFNSAEIIGEPATPAKKDQYEVPVSYEVEASPAMHAFALEANHRRLIPETLPDDNRAEAAVNLLMPLESIRTEAGAYDLLPNAKAGQMRFVRIDPSGGLGCSDFSEKTGKPYEMSASILKGALTTREDASTLTDKKWLLAKGRVEAAPKEAVPPLTVTVPVPELPAKAFNVFLSVETNPNYRNSGPATHVDVQLPGQESMTEFDFANVDTPWRLMRYAVGRAPATGMTFETRIGHKEGEHWTVVDKIELVPLTGIYHSPLMDLSARGDRTKIKPVFKARAAEDSEVRFAVVFGEIDKSGGAKWGEWKNVPPDAPAIPISGSVMQIRAYLMAGMKGSPVVESLGFELLP